MCGKDDSKDHEKNCPVLKIKNRNKGKTKYDFTCKDPHCYRHMWLCSKHKSQDQESMDSKATHLDKDYGLKLVYLLGFNSLDRSLSKKPATSTLTTLAAPLL